MAQQGAQSERNVGVDFSIDRDGELPVGLQLIWRIRGMVGLGVLRPGDRLPSVRELAVFSGANVNTARAAYAALEEEGLLESHQGRGTFVAAAPGPDRDLRAVVDRALAAASEAGATPTDLLAAIHSRAVAPAPPVLDEAGARRVLRAQIAHLERELGDYAWQDRRDPPPPRPETAAPAGAVADAESLERTRNDLLDRLARLRAAAGERGDAEQMARMRRAGMVADPAAHPWEVVDAEEVGERGGGEWQVVPKFGPLGAIMGWWRVRSTRPGGRRD